MGKSDELVQKVQVQCFRSGSGSIHSDSKDEEIHFMLLLPYRWTREAVMCMATGPID